jgi:hypothetical protein
VPGVREQGTASGQWRVDSGQQQPQNKALLPRQRARKGALPTQSASMKTGRVAGASMKTGQVTGRLTKKYGGFTLVVFLVLR